MSNYYLELKKELLAKREQLRNLTRQSKLQGDYHEALIRDFISRFIDDKLAVKHGLIFNNEQLSRECDIIIYEKGKKPLFESGDLVIVNEEFVKFVVQVKSTITSATLKRAIDNLREVKKINKNIMCWIVGFETKLLFRTMYLNARRSGAVQFLHAFHSEKKRESESLLGFQMRMFVDFIRQCGDYPRYCHVNDFVIYKEGKGKPALLLTEDEQKNEAILSEIYSKDLWDALNRREFLSSNWDSPSN
jgi:hypothetical protein